MQLQVGDLTIACMAYTDFIDFVGSPTSPPSPERVGSPAKKKLLAKATQAAAKKKAAEGTSEDTTPPVDSFTTSTPEDTAASVAPQAAGVSPQSLEPATLSTEDQAKIDAAMVVVGTTEAALAQAHANAKTVKEAAEVDERAAAQMEVQAGTNAAKKARASILRRKATASAKAAAPLIQALVEAEAKYADAQKALETLRTSLTPAVTPVVEEKTPAKQPQFGKGPRSLTGEETDDGGFTSSFEDGFASAMEDQPASEDDAWDAWGAAKAPADDDSMITPPAGPSAPPVNVGEPSLIDLSAPAPDTTPATALPAPVNRLKLAVDSTASSLVDTPADTPVGTPTVETEDPLGAPATKADKKKKSKKKKATGAA
jgi:hypothetical protein